MTPTTQQKEEIKMMLDAFASNSFLIPSRHSGYLQFSDSEEMYQTYCNDDRSYITIEIKKADNCVHNCAASKYANVWKISAEDLLTSKTVKAQIATHYKWIKEIYNEIHSLNAEKADAKKKEIRTKIGEKQRELRKITKYLDALKKELADHKTTLKTPNQ